MKWIHIKDKLPEIGVEVIVYCPHKISRQRNPVTALARYITYDGCDENANYFWDNYYGGNNTHVKDAVTHWAHLPVKRIKSAGKAKAPECNECGNPVHSGKCILGSVTSKKHMENIEKADDDDRKGI